MLIDTSLVRKIVAVLLIVALVYVGIGLGFHIRWKRAQAVCRETQIARDEFVEPETFGPVSSLVFDVINWPIYAWANVHHFGDHYSIPCTREQLESARRWRQEVGARWKRLTGCERDVARLVAESGTNREIALDLENLPTV